MMRTVIFLSLLIFSNLFGKPYFTEQGAIAYAKELYSHYPKDFKNGARWFSQVIKDDFKLNPDAPKDKKYVKDLVENYVIEAILDYVVGLRLERKKISAHLQKLKENNQLSYVTKEYIDELARKLTD